MKKAEKPENVDFLERERERERESYILVNIK